jgi:hypothetical protein
MKQNKIFKSRKRKFSFCGSAALAANNEENDA